MITDMSSIDLNEKYSYSEYLKWQFKERVELIKGKLFKMTPAPSRKHQDTSIEIIYQIKNYLKNKRCKVYSAPFDVRFPNGGADKQIYTVVQPDICVICDKNKLDDKGCIGAPDLIIEILSPATGAKDATTKYDLYEENGVKEYWMVYPGEHLVDVFLLNQHGKYELVKKFTREDKVKVNVFEDLFIDLNEVFDLEDI